MSTERKLQALHLQVQLMLKPALEVVHKIVSAELTRTVNDKNVTEDEEERQFLNGLEETYSRLLNEVQVVLDTFS